MRLNWSEQRGTSLVELMTTMALIGILTVVGASFFKILSQFSSVKSAELASVDESMLLLNRLRKAYSVDIVDVNSPPRGHLSSKNTIEENISSSGNTVKAATTLAASISAYDSSNNIVELFTLENRCIDVASGFKDILPQFTREYYEEIFSNESSRYAGRTYTFSSSRCLSFLSTSSGSGSTYFQCGTNQMPAVSLQLKDKNGNRLGSPLSVPGGAGLANKMGSRYQPVAAFFCESLPVVGDKRQLKDITIWSATLNHNYEKQPDKKKRLKWRHQRMILSPPSPSSNVQYIAR